MAVPPFSLDATFTCGAALRCLLDRCPALASSPALATLHREVDELELRGDTVVGDRVASALAQPFLHPGYTIPIVGCFRPVCRGIVDRAVDLLRQARGAPGSGCGRLGGEEVGEGDVEVVEFYVARGCGLRLHELACSALSRALDLAPFLLRSVLNYFGFSPPPFQRLLTSDSLPQLVEKDYHPLLDIVRVSFRFLQMEPDIFSEIWDWSCFLDLVQISAISQVGNIIVSSTSNIMDIRWCSIQIISIILRISDNAARDFGLAASEALPCMLRWEEFCQDTSLEKAGWYLQTVETGTEGFCDVVLNSSLSLKSVGAGSLVSSSTCFQGFMLTDFQGKRRASRDMSSESPFALTSAVKKGFEMSLVAVNQKWPILLHGPAGSGKTALINKLADIYQNQVLFIHMDEQMDSKTLIGSYVCSEQPGEFRWQPGSLTQAVMNGLWVVFEDIDKSPIEVQSILLPLLEGANSFVTVHGEAVTVAESFRLFATVSSSMPDFYHNAEGRISLSSLWRKVLLGAASNKDLLDIISAWHPCLEFLSAELTDTLETANRFTSFQSRGSQIEVASSGVSCRFSTRHLLKLCKRVIGLGIDFSGLALSTSDCKRVHEEVVDIFASSSSSFEERLTIMRDIAKIWGLSDHEIERLHLPNKPVIQDLHLDLQVGRVTLQRTKQVAYHPTRPFANLRSSLNVLEKIACSVKYNEPVLLVGETGTGKTTLVQNLAMRLGQPLTVLNLSQQSDASDLLGGFKPSDTRSMCIPLYREFLELFQRTFSLQGNEELLRRCKSYRDKEDWKKLLGALGKCVKSTVDIFSKSKENTCGSKRKRSEELPKAWDCFSLKLESARKQIRNSAYMSFCFVEGAFITALRKGHWILLDEVNLAPQETLQRVIGVLDGDNGTLCLAEKGDVDYVIRHPCFRIFCCMNPATDAGKRDLPHSFRSRFTEYFVDDVLDDGDLSLFVNQYMEEISTNREVLNRIVQFYKMAKHSEERLQDGANQKPQFSLRSLARALEYTKKAEKKFGIQRALYDGFSMFFVTSLDCPSAKIMRDMIVSCLLGGVMPHDVLFDGYLDKSRQNASVDSYVLTTSVKDHLRNLACAVYIKRYSVLLQGPTSSGKTSLVQYLASITGHKFVRINNHEHTDLQEYFGSYITNSYGRLEFQEGVLVEAVRKGYWVVLDELNLAPSDVLEALNRLLDDNRELFVPELQETVVAHPDFMLFATQNPPTLYAGRKMLSRAFRNRFLEIHVDEIPENELAEILEKRCKIPLSYAKRMVEIMKDLQLHRQKSKVFSGKHGFITPRDLFRWANRFQMFGTSYVDLAKDGYLLLAERLREECEKDVVQEILEQRLRMKLSREELYLKDSSDSIHELQKHAGVLGNTGNIIMTPSMWRLYFLVERCYKLREPVLLIGETGGGKTTVCQLLSAVLGSRLHILNCHQYTEASDFIGGFHPVRDRSRLTNEYKSQIERAKCSKILLHVCQENEISSEIQEASSTISFLKGILDQHKQQMDHPDITEQDLDTFQLVIDALVQLQLKWQTIFLWEDGPLVQAMKSGDLFLVDEISLADDSVLERLNSVLEPERTLLLAEKGGSNLEKVMAHPDFFVLATMNPGGDYGKKELSPALRNRFTEIWVPSVSNIEELRYIASERFVKSELRFLVGPMIKFWEWFNQMETGRMLTVRDLLSWIAFVNETQENLGPVSAFLHGVFLILLDGLSLGTSISRNDVARLRERCLTYLLEQLENMDNVSLVSSQLSNMKTYGWGTSEKDADNSCYNCVKLDNVFGIHPFFIAKGRKECKKGGFEFMAPTTCRNSLRLLRALQLRRPVLLEGSPGVGKTSLVIALAEFSGHDVVRINLSEQTDMMDLLGSDLPVASDNGMEFAWSDGILLQALKNGSWVLLDELNLAPQSVLEGLNAILDHRAEVYIPELGAAFKCPSSFRIFACQNPTSQGGGRKGLPKSFLNRFTKVYVDELGAEDYLFICQSLHPSVPTPLLSKLINFNSRLYEDTMLLHKYGQEGSPWEFNLRDVIRACQIIEGAPEKMKDSSFLSIVYIQRMRTAVDRREVVRLYEEVFGRKLLINQTPRIQINPKFLVVGDVSVPRNYFQPTKVLKTQLNVLPSVRQYLEAILHCVQHQWLCILIGPSSSGKTSLIQLLAQMTGNSLHELNLSSGTDVSELLGCFEQYNAFSTCTDIVRQVEHFMGEYCALRLQSSWEGLLIERKDLIARWLALLAAINGDSCMPNSHFAATLKTGDFSFLSMFVEIIEQLKLDLENYHLPVSWSDQDLTRSLKAILDLQKKIGRQPSANFEWVNGRLVKAVECGEWVVLDNANLCNPTVLDRINSLVEPGGFITVNERGLVDGNPVILHAHPNFRMFITIDPRYGEVSRAMRNRGVEIFVIEQNWLLDGDTTNACREKEIVDVKRFLVYSGIPLCNLIEMMSEAHMYAKNAGLRLGVRVTLLELRRWVQLFQQLLMSGNQPGWSLQLSWEHTYLASLGEAEGRDIVMHVRHSYLSEYKLSPWMGNSLCLPGGWPSPLSLTKFVWFSQEATIKQNCMYLEFLGAQCISYELSVCNRKTSLLKFNKDEVKPVVLPLNFLCQLLFPNSLDLQNVVRAKPLNFDLEMAKKMLFISSNWVIEQATESDLELYILWFKWYALQSHPYCSFFKDFSAILDQERAHPIWNCIINSWREIILHHHINVNQQFLPLLSDKMVDVFGSTSTPKVCTKRLHNAIRCVGVLRLSLEQWNAEKNYVCKAEGLHQTTFPVLESLRHLEEEVLGVITESFFFDHLFDVYCILLQQHRSFWKYIISFDFKNSAMAWHFLEKEALKFKRFFPVATKNLLSMDLIGKSTWNFYILKPLLWMHGGHPYAPSSADIFYKKHQILALCSDVWPRKKFQELPLRGPRDSHLMIDAVLSTNTELRYLAMQGMCMSTFLTKADQENNEIINHLEEIRQGLLRRIEHEKNNLKRNFLPTLGNFNLPIVRTLATTCCEFSAEILSGKPGIDCWLEFVPLFDKSGLLVDMELLQELSRSSFLDSHELFEDISKISDLLRYALDYSMTYSSRPPTDFSAHQKILWILDAWSSLDSVLTRVANVVHEMWFSWHSALWYHCSGLPKVAWDETCLLVQPIRFASLEQILQDAHHISGYDAYNFKIRVISRNLCQDAPPERHLLTYLLTTARSLFQQIIFSHKKSFEEAKFREIKTILHHLSENNKENVPGLKTLILSSSHSGLSSCMDSFIEPLVKELYTDHPQEYVHNLGLAWVHLGLLRFHLLLNSGTADPSMKYAFKLSQITERISMLELEIKVRQECELLAGECVPQGEQDERVHLLKRLKEERNKLEGKVIFRPNPADFENLKIHCDGFLGHQLKFPCNLTNMDEIQSWQVKSAQFIHQLSEKYAAYIDIIQPLQVAVYEMKLGLALIVSSVSENEYLLKVEQSRDMVLATIYSLMQFPRHLIPCADLKSKNTEFACPDVNASASILAVDPNVLKKLVANITVSCTDKDKTSFQQLEASLHHIILFDVAYHVGTSLLMDDTSFSLLNEVFDYFAQLWFGMKFQVKMNKNVEDQHFKFRPRAIGIEDILKVDLSVLSESDYDRDYASELEEMPAGREYVQVKDPSVEGKNLEEEWNLIPEAILKSMLHVHSQLFGSSTVTKYPSVFGITDKEKLHLFLGSYDVGAYIIKGLPETISADLDEKLVVEQMLRVCLQSERNTSWFQQKTDTVNIYKDPNASVMSKMVEPLVAIQERLKYLLSEWSDHPALQNILSATEMLLSIPLDTPLSKALFGLESLLARTQSLQETCPKFSLADRLEPVYSLVYSWQKIELDSWPNLLDGVEEQYEINAGKLWFPLHSVLHRNLSGNADLDNMFTMERVEEFMETSSLGEFKKRLQLLLAFHGQFNTGISMNVYSSSHQKEVLKILYNAFGYYIQFLPSVMKHMNAKRRCKEEEIKNEIKLLKWEHPNTFLSIERFRVARHKLWKLIQKFNDVLQQPLMVFLNQEANINNSGVAAWFKQKSDVEPDNELMPFPVEPTHFGVTERLLRHHSWREKINLASEASGIKFASPISLSLFSECDGFLAASSKGWALLENIYSHATDFAHVWKHGTKSLKKRRSLTDLLKILEASGLSRHRSLIAEVEARSSQLSTLLRQSSYDVQHLLLQDGDSSHENISDHQMLNNSNPDLKWKTANQHYFNNIAMLQQLWQARLSFHKDLSLEQVNRAMSFIDHLTVIQQGQRSTLYALWEQFKQLRRHSSSLESPGTGEFSLSSDQHVLLQCMWQQKKLFDMLVTLSKDMSLLLRCIGNGHLSACRSVRAQVETISTFIDKHIQSLVKSKELLDKCLLHECGVITTSVVCKTPFIMSKQMEIFVMQNFQIIYSLDDDVQNFRKSKAFNRSICGILLNHFTELITKGKLVEKEFLDSLAAKDCSTNSCQADSLSKETFVKLDASFTKSSVKTINMVEDSIQKVVSSCKELASLEDMPIEKITSWNVTFEKFVSQLHLEPICGSFCETVISAGKLLNHSGNKDLEVCAKVEIQLKHLHVLLDLFLSIVEAIILDFLAVHNAIAEMSNMLAQIFAFLFSEGFGDSEEPVDDTSSISQDATGTGMGEGEGLNDVSDQIDDETQLLGTSEKQNQGPENSEKLPSTNDEGIEMDEEFAADAFSVSEDSGDDASENEEMNIESVMGENVDSSQVIDEKLWDKEEDANANKNLEKYELGASVKETDPSQRELRGREDASNDVNESGELTDEESETLSGKEENQNASDDEESSADATMDESNAFEDSSGMLCNEQKQECEEGGINEAEDSLAQNEGIDENMEDETSQSNTMEDHMDLEESGEVEKTESDEGDKTNAKDTNMDMMGTTHESIDLQKSVPENDPSSEKGSLEPVHDSFAADLKMMPETHLSNSHDLQRSFVLSKGLPSEIPRSEPSLPDLTHGEMFSVDKPNIESSEDDPLSSHRPSANPYRSIGDAMEEWRDRVKISDDPQEHQSDVPDDAVDVVGDEYQFISEMEKGSSQTLGPATSDQVNQSIDRKDPTIDDHMNEDDDIEPMEMMKVDNEREYIRRCETSMYRQKTEQSVKQLPDEVEKTDASMEGFERDNSIDGLGNFASFENSSVCEEPFQSNELTAGHSVQMEVETAYNAVKDDSPVDWKRYERMTTRLSQELCEQLRLVMEPTVASKLQGDYKTGKRINMKKVIPYIASHFRKDKIWLRRTRPNKRDYQVVVAIDDSRSMSESNCGSFAIEALITICRAMSQLEVGQFAVTSFGEKGNIKLLNDFDQPFTGETGTKIISSLSFKQDNTIRDEPVVDLLKYLDNLLDNAVARARLPSGINPLKQLVLIIADGRFQDKEKLRRCVRDILSKKRMIAFVLLDNPHESIMDLPEYSFIGGKFSCTKYMDSFPFPYYVLLRNIEALPRTVADLLRQWFQLMQSARE